MVGRIIIIIQCRMEKMKNSLEEKRHSREKWKPAASVVRIEGVTGGATAVLWCWTGEKKHTMSFLSTN